MKFFCYLSFVMVSVLLSVCCLAQVSATSTEVLMSSGDFFSSMLTALGGIKNASTMGIIIIVLQIIFKFLNSELAGKIGFLRNLEPGVKLIIILVISYATGILTLMNTGEGLSFGAAFIHSSSMSALMVLLNQVYKKFVSDK